MKSLSQDSEETIPSAEINNISHMKAKLIFIWKRSKRELKTQNPRYQIQEIVIYNSTSIQLSYEVSFISALGMVSPES